MAFSDAVLAHARQHVGRTLYAFTPNERKVLAPFFTNVDRSVFFMFTLPQSVGDVLFAMYSRMKNPRGVRGVFVDSFLPLFLAITLRETRESCGGDPERFIRERKIASLEDFLGASDEARGAFADFLRAFSVDPKYITTFSTTEKVKRFLSLFLDRYGHNSIARMAGGIWIGFEQISILAAKSIEWGRPGSGYIELSTRYVDMGGKDLYPIADELALCGVAPGKVAKVIDACFDAYRTLQGERFSGPLPSYLREAYGALYQGFPKDLDAGVIGETCDVLGNFLPAATLTSVGVCVSGEALPGLIKHLMLDRAPETIALAEALVEESSILGYDQFLRHMEIAPWDECHWTYLAPEPFAPERAPKVIVMERDAQVRDALVRAFEDSHPAVETFDDVLALLARTERGAFDKLPHQFEYFTAAFRGVMSFRGWRDLQRMGFCTHHRTYLTPTIGFYRYNKPVPFELYGASAALIHGLNKAIFQDMADAGVPAALMQYPLALGNLVGFHIGANLREWEFCIWQRGDYSVNHEVRVVFLSIDRSLRTLYPWWGDLSRGDTTPAYVFARGGKAIPLAPQGM